MNLLPVWILYWHTLFLNYLEKLNQEDNLTIICSLHYLDLVQRYATTVVGLRDGKLVYQGSREEIRKMRDDEFKAIYGEEAERISDGLEGHIEGSAR
jgi:phosphonate transport system ATP-binding protein